MMLMVIVLQAQSSPAGTFCHFNMFNHYIFDNSFMYLRKFLSSADQSQFAIVLDPPFGGMVEAIAESMMQFSFISPSKMKS